MVPRELKTILSAREEEKSAHKGVELLDALKGEKIGLKGNERVPLDPGRGEKFVNA